MSVAIPSRSRASSETGTRVSIRLELAGGARVGPGKIALLEEIARSGSISAAGRVMKMSYRRAWELVEDLNRNLGAPVVSTASGGSGGGGAQLTEAGALLVREYRAIETESVDAAGRRLAALAGVFQGKSATEG
jgi:molybdate transport system regulatory protein